MTEVADAGMPAPAPGAALLSQYQKAGFSSDEIDDYRSKVSAQYVAAGFSQQDVNDYWGIKTPNTAGVKAVAATAQPTPNSLTPDNPAMRSEMVGSYERGETKNPTEFSQAASRGIVGYIADSISRGANVAGEYAGGVEDAMQQTSERYVGTMAYPFLSTAQQRTLVEKGIVPPEGGTPLPENATITAKIVHGIAAGIGTDSPIGIAMSAPFMAVSAPTAPIVDAALKSAEKTAKEKGLPSGSESIIPDAFGIVMNMIGIKGLGHVGGEATPTAWDNAPKAQDFVDAARTHGDHAEVEVSQVLRNIYAEQGIHPAQVVADAQTQPVISQDIAAGNVPKVYTPPVIEKAAGTPVEADAAQARALVGQPQDVTPDRTVDQESVSSRGTVQYQREGATKAELFDKAKEFKPAYEDFVRQMTDGIPGANPYDEGVGGDTGVRIKNEKGRIDEKIAENKGNAGAVSDYLGGAIEVKSPEVMQQVIDRIRASGKKIIEVEDMLSSDDKYKNDGYRAIHMQVEMEPGFTAELQLLPKSVAAIKEKLHPAYVKLRYEDATAPELEDMREQLVSQYSKAFEKFAGNPEGETVKTQVKYPVQNFLKKQGGVEAGSTLADELNNMGVNARTAPGLFKAKGKGGLKDVDNFPLSEWKLSAAPDDGSGYVARDYILEAIRDERAGKPITKQYEDTQVFDEARDIADRHRLAEEYGISAEGKSANQFWSEVAERQSRAENDKLLLSKQEAEEAIAKQFEKLEKEFVESRGEAWEPITAHTATLEDLENERRQENNAIAKAGGAANTAIAGRASGAQATGEEAVGRNGGGADLAGRAGPQTEIPGTERITDRQLAEMKMQGAKRPSVIQKAADEGLFDVAGRSQSDLMDFLKSQEGALYLSKPAIPRTASENAVLKKILVGGEKENSPALSWNEFYRSTVDKLDPVRRITDAVIKGNLSPALDDTYKLMRNQAGNYGRAQHFIEQGTFDFKTYKNTGKSLKDIIAPVQDDVQGLRAYAAARRAIELEDRGIKSGMPQAEAKQVIIDGAKKYEPIFKQLSAYQDSVLKYLKDSGVLTDEQLKSMRGANKSYVPFYRVMDDETFGQPGGARVKNPIKRIKGSERDIIDPIESIVRNTYSYVAIAEKNAAIKSFYDGASRAATPDDYFTKQQPLIKPTRVSETEMNAFLKKEGIQEIPQDTLTVFRAMRTPLAKDEVGFFDSGKWTVLKVDPDLAEAFNGTPRMMHGFLFKAIALPAKMLRYGLIEPAFIIRHLERNSLSATIIGSEAKIPFENIYQGMMSYLKKDEWYDNWLKSGGKVSAISGMTRDDVRDQMYRITSEYPAANMLTKAWNIVKTPFDLIHAFQQSLENINRLGAFKQKLQGLNIDRANIIDSGYYARNIAPDPSRIGKDTGLWNSITALANTEIQHTAQLVDALRNRPIPTLAKGFAYITLPTLALWAVNHNDPRYKEIPAWERDAFWIVPAGGYMMRIPKPFFMGFLFASVPERIMDALAGDDKHGRGIEDAIKDMFEQATPNTIPTALTPILEQITNHSMFRGTPLVPDHLMQQLPEYRYSEYTSELTKAVGKLVGKVPYVGATSMASPVVIDNYLRAWTGTMGTYVKEAIDASLRKAGVLPDPLLPANTLADIPFVRAFAVRYPSAQAESIQRFQGDYHDMAMVTNSYKALVKQGEYAQAQQLAARNPGAFVKLDQINKTINESNQLVRAIYKNPEIKPDEKRQLIDATYLRMIQIAHAGNDLIETLKGLPAAKTATGQ